MGAVSRYKLVVHTLPSAKREGILWEVYRDRNGRCIAMLFKVLGSGVDLTLLIYIEEHVYALFSLP